MGGFNFMSAVGGFAKNRSEHMKEKRANNQKMIEKQYDEHAATLKEMRSKRTTRSTAHKSARDTLSGMGLNDANQRLVLSGGLVNSAQVITNLKTHVNRHSEDEGGKWDINTLFQGPAGAPRDTTKIGTFEDIRSANVGDITASFDQSKRPKGGNLLGHMFGSTTADMTPRGTASLAYGKSAGSGNGFVSNYDDWLSQQAKKAKTSKDLRGPTVGESRYSKMDKGIATRLAGGFKGKAHTDLQGVTTITLSQEDIKHANYVNDAFGALRAEARDLDTNGTFKTAEDAGNYVAGLIKSNDVDKLNEILGRRVKGLKWMPFINVAPNQPPSSTKKTTTTPLSTKSIMDDWKVVKSKNNKKVEAAFKKGVRRALIQKGTHTTAQIDKIIAQLK